MGKVLCWYAEKTRRTERWDHSAVKMPPWLCPLVYSSLLYNSWCVACISGPQLFWSAAHGPGLDATRAFTLALPLPVTWLWCHTTSCHVTTIHQGPCSRSENTALEGGWDKNVVANWVETGFCTQTVLLDSVPWTPSGAQNRHPFSKQKRSFHNASCRDLWIRGLLCDWADIPNYCLLFQASISSQCVSSVLSNQWMETSNIPGETDFNPQFWDVSTEQCLFWKKNMLVKGRNCTENKALSPMGNWTGKKKIDRTWNSSRFHILSAC